MESSEVNGKRRRLVAGKLEEESGIKTACYPKDFKLICDALSRSKRDAVVEMGFGPLLEIGCIKLIRDLCEMFVDNFEVQQGRCTIKIHGILLSVNVADFERLMGVRNCGTQVELERCSGPDDMKELKRKLCGGNGDISIDSMKQRLDSAYGKPCWNVKISVPMHEPTSKSKPNTGHWYLLRIHVKDRYVELVDSLEDETKLISRRHDAKRTMNMLDAILGEDIVNLLDGICSFASLPWYYTTPIRQPNTADCGVFVLRNMEDPTSKWAQKYDSHSERLRLLLDCLRHEKNEISDIHSKVQQSLLSWKGGKKQPKQVSKANDSKAAPFVVNLISGDT